MQPDRSYEVAFPYAARHHARTASGSSPCGCHHDDFRCVAWLDLTCVVGWCRSPACFRLSCMRSSAAAQPHGTPAHLASRRLASHTPHLCTHIATHRLLTVMDAAQGGPLWSAAGVTRSEAGGTPCGSPTSAALCRASGAFGTAADLAQGHAASQQQSPVGGDVMPLPGEAPAAETAPQPGSPGLAAFKHRRRRSFDVSWLGRRLEKEAQLAPLEKELEACSPAAAAAAAAAAEAASCVELGVACSPQGSPVSVLPSLPRVPRHFRSRSASVASQVFGAGRAEEMV